MTETIRKRIQEIRVGLEGVPEGPWRLGGNPCLVFKDDDDIDDTAIAACHDRTEYGEKGSASAAHVARCDPDTMREICEWAERTYKSKNLYADALGKVTADNEAKDAEIEKQCKHIAWLEDALLKTTGVIIENLGAPYVPTSVILKDRKYQ